MDEASAAERAHEVILRVSQLGEVKVSPAVLAEEMWLAFGEFRISAEQRTSAGPASCTLIK